MLLIYFINAALILTPSVNISHLICASKLGLHTYYTVINLCTNNPHLNLISEAGTMSFNKLTSIIE